MDRCKWLLLEPLNVDADVILVNSTGFDDHLMERITALGCPGMPAQVYIPIEPV